MQSSEPTLPIYDKRSITNNILNMKKIDVLYYGKLIVSSNIRKLSSMNFKQSLGFKTHSIIFIYLYKKKNLLTCVRHELRTMSSYILLNFVLVLLSRMFSLFLSLIILFIDGSLYENIDERDC